jgi:hypothetical protein
MCVYVCMCTCMYVPICMYVMLCMYEYVEWDLRINLRVCREQKLVSTCVTYAFKYVFDGVYVWMFGVVFAAQIHVRGMQTCIYV